MKIKKRFNKKNNEQLSLGFTMIELLIVIVILGILSAVGLGAFSSAQLKSRDSNRKSNLKGIATALEVYYNDYGSYPLDDGGGTGEIAGCGIGGAEVCSYGAQWQDDNGTVYMVQIPEDPTANTFFYVSDGTEYQIYARLENVDDRDVPLATGNVPGKYTPVNNKCGGSGCNYGIASTNSSLGAIEVD